MRWVWALTFAALAPGAGGADEGWFGQDALTEADRRGFVGQITRCWNLASASSEVLQTQVTVAFTMSRDGRPEIATIRMTGYEGGTEDSAQVAFRMAKSAILRCTGEGFDLPVGAYEQWRNVELTFDPERMRLR